MKLESRHCLKLSCQRALRYNVSHGKEYRDHGVWVGEQAGANNPVSNYRSSWDANWTGNYGGLDTPIRRRDATVFRWRLSPARIPSIVRCRTTMSCTASLNRKRRLLSHGSNRPTRDLGQSVCKDRWVAIRKENRTCYAQWEDCGPFRTDHFQYVFQNERPKPNLNDGAGLDVFSRSPRLPPTPTDGHDRLAICRGAGCASGSLEELRRKQPFSSSRGGKPSST